MTSFLRTYAYVDVCEREIVQQVEASTRDWIVSGEHKQIGVNELWRARVWRDDDNGSAYSVNIWGRGRVNTHTHAAQGQGWSGAIELHILNENKSISISAFR